MASFAEQMGNIVADLAASAAARASYLADLRQECNEDQANREHLTEERREAVQELLTDFASKSEERREAVQELLKEHRDDFAAGAAVWAGRGGRQPRAERKEESEASSRKKHKPKRH